MKKNIWRSEYGIARTGSTDIYGSVIEFEYSRQMSNRLFLAPAFSILSFSSLSNSVSTIAKATSAEIKGYYLPINKGVVNLELGLGVFLRYWNWQYATGPNSSFATGDFFLDNSSEGSQQYATFGYTFSLGTIIHLGDKVALSARFVLQNDTGGDIVISMRPGLIIKF